MDNTKLIWLGISSPPPPPPIYDAAIQIHFLSPTPNSHVRGVICDRYAVVLHDFGARFVSNIT